MPRANFEGMRLRLLLCCIVFSCIAHAQRYPFLNFGIEDGLVQSQASFMVQDRYGQLWIGTLGGLSCYDGGAFRNYTVRHGLRHNVITSLTATADGSLWIGGEAGITRYDGYRFHYLPMPSAKPNLLGSTVQFCNADSSSIWFIFQKKLYRAYKNKIVQTPLPNGTETVSAINTDKHYTLSAVSNTAKRLYTLSSGRWSSFALPANGPNSTMRLVPLAQDRLALLAQNGIWLWQNNSLTPFYPAQLAPYYHDSLGATNLLQALDGAYWISLNAGGVVRLVEGNAQWFTKANGLCNNRLPALLQDREGNLWLGSDGEGIYRFAGTSLSVFDERAGLPSNQVMSLINSADGSMWMGTYDAGLYQWKNGKAYKVNLPSAASKVVVAMAHSANGGLWIGTHGHGLYHYNGGYTNFNSDNSSFPSNRIISLYEGTGDTLWIGFENGAGYLHRGRFYTLPVNGRVAHFMAIGSDSMLVATGRKIWLYSNDKLNDFKTHSVADQAQPECFAFANNKLWIGTADQGIIAFDLRSKKAQHFHTGNVLKNDFIYSLAIDKQGQLWAGTGSGVCMIKEDKSGAYQTIHFGKQQGVPEAECNHNAILALPDGNVWVGTTRGILRFNHNRAHQHETPESIMMTAVLLNGEQIKDSTYFKTKSAFHQVPIGLRLPPSKNNLSFAFRAISLSGMEHIQYRYKMEGLTDEWSEWSIKSELNYPSLPPGNYVLLIQARSNDRDQVQQLSYPFEIITPLHKQAWFIALLSLGAILGVIGIQYYLTLQKQKRQEELITIRRTEQRKIRQRTAEDFHDEVGNKITRINVLANVMRSKLPAQEAGHHRLLDLITESTSQLYNGTRDILWSLDPNHDNLYEILNRITYLGEECFNDAGINFRLTGNHPDWKSKKISLHHSRNLTMIFKEAFNNILKYAQAKNVTLTTILNANNAMLLLLQDDGVGFDLAQPPAGNGLKNMSIRAARIGADWKITSSQKGTQIALTLPPILPNT